MNRVAGTILMLIGAAGIALAGGGGFDPAPEIDPSSAVNGLALIGGALMVIRGRRRRVTR